MARPAVKPHPPEVDAFTRAVSWFVSTRPGAWFFTRVAMRIDRRLMPLTKGRVRMSLGMPSLLLSHRGAKSNAERTTPLLYFTVGDDVILLASNGGAPKHPAWYHNVRAHPEVSLSNGGASRRYEGREAEGDERQRLFGLACQMYPGYARYQARTGGRRIPVMVFSPSREG
jgi:deazaflavin-dependent oxidoreductase (nitroreductase family)